MSDREYIEEQIEKLESMIDTLQKKLVQIPCSDNILSFYIGDKLIQGNTYIVRRSNNFVRRGEFGFLKDATLFLESGTVIEMSSIFMNRSVIDTYIQPFVIPDDELDVYKTKAKKSILNHVIRYFGSKDDDMRKIMNEMQETKKKIREIQRGLPDCIKFNFMPLKDMLYSAYRTNEMMDLLRYIIEYEE